MAKRCNAHRAMLAGQTVSNKSNPEFYAMNTITNEIIPCHDRAHAVVAAKAACKKDNAPNTWVACEQTREGFHMLDMDYHYPRR